MKCGFAGDQAHFGWASVRPAYCPHILIAPYPSRASSTARIDTRDHGAVRARNAA